VTKKTILIACEGASTLPLDSLEPFQGDFKRLEQVNGERLKHEILFDGFSDPFNIWRDEGHYWILDGHQRRLTLISLREEGYEIPELPVVWVDAASFEQAKRKVLAQASQYGEVQREGLLKLMAEAEVQTLDLLSSFRFPEIPPILFADGENDPYAEWTGMPSFGQQDKLGYQTIAVHFADKEGVEKFALLVEQKLTPKTRSLWFPEVPDDITHDERYVSES